MTDLEAQQVADAARAVPGVVDLSCGPTDQFRSYLPGGHTVAGVRFDDDTLRINLVASWNTPLPALGEQIRTAVTPFAGGREVIVAVDDIVGDLDSIGITDSPVADGRESL